MAHEKKDVAGARAVVRSALADYSEETVETAALLASELVTNGLLHGAGVATLDIRLVPARIRVEVADRNKFVTALVALNPEPRSEKGRGLLLVDRLASCWGVQPREEGKIVWFELEL